MNKFVFHAFVLYIISYLIIYFALHYFLLMINVHSRSGLFHGIIIQGAAFISVYYLSKNLICPPNLKEKISLVLFSLLFAIVFNIVANFLFNVSLVSVGFWIFYLFILWIFYGYAIAEIIKESSMIK